MSRGVQNGRVFHAADPKDLPVTSGCPSGAGRGLLRRILGVIVPNKLLNAKKLSNDWVNVRFVLGDL
jgi:hypothetical protein